MKITTTTDWEIVFLRRMVTWCCLLVGGNSKDIREIHFGKRSSRAFNGRAWLWQRRIRVMIGPERAYPVEPHPYRGRTSKIFYSPHLKDQMAGLIAVTTHECAHIIHQSSDEGMTRTWERKAIKMFEENREELLASWTPAHRGKTPQPTRAQKNEMQTRANLERWESRLKRAQNAVNKYRQKVRYYDRRNLISDARPASPS